MIITIEILVLIVLFTFMISIMSKNPIATLYNYPPKIQERVKELEEYKDKIPTTVNKIIAKSIFTIMIVLIISLILRYFNGYTTFIEGFGYSLLMWTIINIYDAIVIDILWFCHNPKFVFKGTEDMVEEYHNYWFHIKESFKGEVIGSVVCILIGLVIQFIL